MSRARSIRIAPSLLAADFAQLAAEVRKVEAAAADLLHVDVMDGHFVPNLAIGVPVVQSLARCTDLLLDTHLMVEDPARLAPAFVKAGAGTITFHVEVAPRPEELVRRIRDLGVKVGIALNPDTPADAVFSIIDAVDIVCVMTVWPGFGGQSFMHECMSKVEILAERLAPQQWLEVDGGIGLETVRTAVEAGADTLIAGTSVFGAGDAGRAVGELRAIALEAAASRAGSRA
ncbi:MAG: Ribulose-phosphate 3-epimerase [Phycisphaerae bacterium]|nr:Ribulose-phosphate 3-epimerase [Phycisphaerae bacterium]